MVQIDVLGNLREAARLFSEIAQSDPLSAVLVAIGGLVILVSVGAFGLLSLGALISFLARLVREPVRRA